MIVRQDFQEMPPKSFMMQVMDDISRVYCFLWDKRDPLNRIEFTWMELSSYYHRNFFRTKLRKLNEGGLLDFYESDEGITIELTGWDQFEDERLD